jgi:hypothetical protein
MIICTSLCRKRQILGAQGLDHLRIFKKNKNLAVKA